MATPALGTFLRRLKQAMTTEAMASCSDQDLIEQFRSTRDEASFRAILDRHGPMVFHVCRRLLSSHSDIEDAFQATFLILIRRGHTIRSHSSLGSWLHGVSRRTALKLRTQGARRLRRETRSAKSDQAGTADDTTWGEVRGILDDELQRLPESCRAPLVLCYLEGQTQDEAAARLGVSKSTLRRHLDRGRDLLGRRLAKRGVTLGAALAARLVSECAQGAGVPQALLLRTAQSAKHTAANLAAPASVVPTRVAALTDGVMKTMNYAKYKTIVAMLACSLALGVGVYEFSPQLASAQEKIASAKSPPATPAPDIEPINPNLVFEPEIQKQLRLSPNQIRQLTEARAKGGETTADQSKRMREIDQRIQKLQDEINRLSEERNAAEQQIQKAQGEQVKSAIPKVLSRDAVQELRQITLQRMQLSDVLLDAKIRARLELNDEQVKKIQELSEKRDVAVWQLATNANTKPYTAVEFLNVTTNVTAFPYSLGTEAVYFSVGLSDTQRAEFLKVLTPQQREALERLSGMKFEKAK